MSEKMYTQEEVNNILKDVEKMMENAMEMTWIFKEYVDSGKINFGSSRYSYSDIKSELLKHAFLFDQTATCDKTDYQYELEKYTVNFLSRYKNGNGYWYEEKWSDDDLASALIYNDLPVNSTNIEAMRECCAELFADKSDRNEQIQDVAASLVSEPIVKKFMMIITAEDERHEKGEKTLSYYADRPWEGIIQDIIYGDTREELFEQGDIEGLFYQLYDNIHGKRISYGSVDYDAISEETAEFLNRTR